MSIKEKLALWIATREVRKRIERWIEKSIARPLTRRERAMLNSLIGNWKTSLLGLIMAAVTMHQGGMTWHAALMAAAMAALGIAAKDSTTGSQATQ